MVQVLEQGPADAIPDYNEGPPRALCIRCRLAHLIPAYWGVNTFVIACHISGWGRGKVGAGWRQQIQNPKGVEGGSDGDGSHGETQVNAGGGLSARMRAGESGA